MTQIECIICHKVVSTSWRTQKTCLSPECKRAHKHMFESRRQDRGLYRSKSGLCAVCRGPLPVGAGPNTRVCSKECREIATKYQLDLDVYVMPDEEYQELGLEPPEPGFKKCLGHGLPKHTFWSPDKKRIRICQHCKQAAETGALIHVGGNLAWVCDDFAYLDGIAMSSSVNPARVKL